MATKEKINLLQVQQSPNLNFSHTIAGKGGGIYGSI